jgi:hypothetical protein
MAIFHVSSDQKVRNNLEVCTRWLANRSSNLDLSEHMAAMDVHGMLQQLLYDIYIYVYRWFMIYIYISDLYTYIYMILYIYIYLWYMIYIYIHMYIYTYIYIWYIVYCGNGDEPIDFEALKPTFSSSSRSSCLAPDRCGTFCSGQDDRGGTAGVMTAKKKRQICSFPWHLSITVY